MVLYEAPNYALTFLIFVLIATFIFYYSFKLESKLQVWLMRIFSTLIFIIYIFGVLPTSFLIEKSKSNCQLPECELISGVVDNIETKEEIKKNIINIVHISNREVVVGRIGQIIGYRKIKEEGGVLHENEKYELYLYNGIVIKIIKG